MVAETELLPSDHSRLLGACYWTQKEAVNDYNDYLEETTKKSSYHRKWEYYSNQDLLEKETSGDKKIKALTEALNRFDHLGYKRSKHQIRFHKTFISAILKLIYGQEIYEHLARLLREYELDELRPDVIVCTPRRYGKTTSVGLFVAALLWTQPGFKVDIYSTGRRASKKLLALVYKLVLLLAGGDENVIVTYNQETLEVRTPSGAISTCNSYPSKVQIDVLIEKSHPTHTPLSYINALAG